MRLSTFALFFIVNKFPSAYMTSLLLHRFILENEFLEAFLMESPKVFLEETLKVFMAIIAFYNPAPLISNVYV